MGYSDGKYGRAPEGPYGGKGKDPLGKKKQGQVSGDNFFELLNLFIQNLPVICGVLLIYVLLFMGVWVTKGPKTSEASADFMFLFDTTNSMQEEIDSMIGASISFAGELSRRQIDFRIAAITFGASDDPPVVRDTVPFTRSGDDISEFFSKQRAHGGGKEDHYTAIREAIESSKFEWREEKGVHKVMIIITDEDPIAVSGTLWGETMVVRKLKEHNIRLYVIGREWFPSYIEPSGEEQSVFVRMTEDLNGRFYRIERIQSTRDFSSLLNDLVKHVFGSFIG
jgi:Mg-chelatase subunit ChlD